MNQVNADLNVGRDLHRVATKAALYTPDASHVLVMHMYKGTEREMYGLPGGHVDAGETPDDTIVRELNEELGINVQDLRHADFFMHENGKVVLAYVGEFSNDIKLMPADPAKEIGVWLNLQEFKDIAIEANYRNLILKHWPNQD